MLAIGFEMILVVGLVSGTSGRSAPALQDGAGPQWDREAWARLGRALAPLYSADGAGVEDRLATLGQEERESARRLARAFGQILGRIAAACRRGERVPSYLRLRDGSRLKGRWGGAEEGGRASLERVLVVISPSGALRRVPVAEMSLVSLARRAIELGGLDCDGRVALALLMQMEGLDRLARDQVSKAFEAAGGRRWSLLLSAPAALGQLADECRAAALCEAILAARETSAAVAALLAMGGSRPLAGTVNAALNARPVRQRILDLDDRDPIDLDFSSILAGQSQVSRRGGRVHLRIRYDFRSRAQLRDWRSGVQERLRTKYGDLARKLTRGYANNFRILGDRLVGEGMALLYHVVPFEDEVSLSSSFDLVKSSSARGGGLILLLGLCDSGPDRFYAAGPQAILRYTPAGDEWGERPLSSPPLRLYSRYAMRLSLAEKTLHFELEGGSAPGAGPVSCSVAARALSGGKAFLFVASHQPVRFGEVVLDGFPRAAWLQSERRRRLEALLHAAFGKA